MEKEFILAGALAIAIGVSTDTLRHYERKGVIGRPRRSSNGYRLYHKDTIARLLLVRRAMSFGFTLDELARVLKERDKGSTPCREVRQLMGKKLADIEEQLESLKRLRKELGTIVSSWDARLAATDSGKRAHLLESLPDGGDSISKFKNKGKRK